MQVLSFSAFFVNTSDNIIYCTSLNSQILDGSRNSVTVLPGLSVFSKHHLKMKQWVSPLLNLFKGFPFHR